MFVFVAATISILVLLVFAFYVGRAVQDHRAKARDRGYATLGAYLRAVPRDDAERRDAVDMAMQGVVLCVLGLAFPLLLIVGIFPLYFGGRKIAYSSMGLGLLDDADQPGA